MIHEFLVRDRIDEVLREAEKARMIEKVRKARKDRSQHYLNTFLCRFGLNSVC
jgi:hypothetical protein